MAMLTFVCVYMHVRLYTTVVGQRNCDRRSGRTEEIIIADKLWQFYCRMFAQKYGHFHVHFDENFTKVFSFFCI